MAWSRPKPASMETTRRSNASGRERRSTSCRLATFFSRKNRGKIQPAPMPDAMRPSFMTGLGGILASSMMHNTSISKVITMRRPQKTGSAFFEKKVAKRQEVLRLSLPDALDLLVVSIEAGLGLDQAIQHVARELYTSHPELSDEM